LKAINPDMNQRYANAVDMQKALRAIEIVSQDAHLDQMFAGINKPYQELSYLNYQPQSYKITETDLPTDIKNYMREIDTMKKNRPDKFAEVFFRYKQLLQLTWQNPHLNKQFKPIGIVKLHSLLLERATSTRNIEPQFLDSLENVMSSVIPDVQYDDLLISIAPHQLGRLDELIQRANKFDTKNPAFTMTRLINI